MLTPQEYRKLKIFLTNLMVKSNGSLTKFARKYSIEKFSDFYQVFKELKKNLKTDKEGLAFAVIKDAAKTYVGKVWRRMPGSSPEQKVFNAWSVTLDYIALILDNLKVLKETLKQMEKEGIEKKHILEACNTASKKKKKKAISEDAIKKIIKALKLHT